MANELTQFTNDNPVLNPISPVVKEKNKILADVFGTVASTAISQANAIRKEQSDVEFMTAQNNVLDIKSKSEAAIYKNPGMAAQIAEKAREGSTEIAKNFSGSSLAKINKVISEHLGAVDILAARVGGGVDKKLLLGQFHSTLDGQLEDAKSTYDPEHLDQKIRSMFDLIDKAKEGNIIDGNGVRDATEKINDVLALQGHMHDMLQSTPGVDAAKYNAINNISFNNGDPTKMGAPIDENTRAHYDFNDQEHTYRSAQVSVEHGMIPNWETMAKLKPDQAAKIRLNYLGAMDAQGLIDAATSRPLIIARMKELSVSRNRNSRETGELVRLQNLMKEQKFDYLGSTDKTPAGQEIGFQHAQQEAVINQTSYDSEKQKNYAIIKNFNDDIGRHDSLRRSQHIGSDEVNLIRPEIAENINSSFKFGADPDKAIGTVKALDRDKKYWATNAVKDYTKKAALWGVAQLQMNLPVDAPNTNFMKALVYAAQDGHDFSALAGVTASKKEVMRLDIAQKMKDTLSFVSNQPEGNAATGEKWASGTVELGMSYVQARMMKDKDLKGDNYSRYADEFAEQYGGAFKISRGLNYVFNINEINISNFDASILANHELVKYHTALTKRLGSQTASDRQFNDNPVMVTNTRDGDIIVRDSFGNVLHSEHYTDRTLALARKRADENTREINEEFERTHTKSNITNPEGIF